MSDGRPRDYRDPGWVDEHGKPLPRPGYQLGYMVGTSIADAMLEILKATVGADLLQKVDARTQANLRFSAAVTEAVKLTRSIDRRGLGRELRAFMEKTAQPDPEEVYAVWLNLKAMQDTGQAMALAEAYDLDPYLVGQALLTGYPAGKVETLAHIASVTGQDVYGLVIQALNIEANGAKAHGE